MIPRCWLVFIVIICSSCATVYVPNARNVPLFSRAKEFSGNASIGLSTNVQAAYSITDHLGIMGSYLYTNNKSDKRFAYRKHQFGEVGVGYYTHTDVKYELYAGVGWGKGNGQDSTFGFFDSFSYPIVADGRYCRVFFQPSIGIGNAWFEVGFTTRLSIVNFTELAIQRNYKNETLTKSTESFFEPAITMRLSPLPKRNVYVLTQIGVSVPFNSEADFDHEAFQLSFGIGVHLGKH